MYTAAQKLTLSVTAIFIGGCLLFAAHSGVQHVSHEMSCNKREQQIANRQTGGWSWADLDAYSRECLQPRVRATLERTR